MARTVTQLAAFLVCILFGAIPLWGVELDATTRVRATGRPGLHHADVVGRVVDHIGVPVDGARVLLKAGNSRGLPLAETVSGVNGEFSFADISAEKELLGIVEPGRDWMPAYFAVRGVSAAAVHVGDVRLSLNTTVRIVLDYPQVSQDASEIDGLRVVFDPSGQRHGRIVAKKRGRAYVLDNITHGEGVLEVSRHSGERSEIYTADVSFALGRRDQGVIARVVRDSLQTRNELFDEGELELLDFIARPLVEPRKFVQGTIKTPDGLPLEGAIVGIDNSMFGAWQVSTSMLGEDGAFRLRTFGDYCPVLSVSIGCSSGRRLKAYQGEGKCRLPDLLERMLNLTADDAIPLQVEVAGLNPAQSAALRLRWWHAQTGWRELPARRSWVLPSSYRAEIFLSADAPGVLPSTVRLKAAESGGDGKQRVAESLEHRFEFGLSTGRTLVVSSSGQPVPGAVVDLEQIEDIRKDERSSLAVYRTDSLGQVKLLGEPDGLYEVFVYAEGYTPERAFLHPGTTEIELVPKNARIKIADCRRGQTLRVKRAGGKNPVAIVRVPRNGSVEIPVSGGEYDVTLLDETGHVLTGLRARAIAGEVSSLSSSQDNRPLLRVRFPSNQGWSARPARDGPGGQPFGAAIYSIVGGPGVQDGEPVAQVVSRSDTEMAWRLTGAGKHQVLCSRKGLPYTFFRDVTLTAGEEMAISVPALGASLAGSMKTYQGGLGYSHHGWAGPRLWLRAVGREGWDLLLHLPQRLDDDRFLLTDLPIGDYHVHQHLIGETRTYEFRGEVKEYAAARDAWGGIPVTLLDGQQAELDEFDEYPYRDVPVRVTYADGRPVARATLAVRDAMSDAWQKVATGPTTLSSASHPIPMPPAVPVINGDATLPAIRAGRLELKLVTDGGLVYWLSQDVTPAETLEIELPENAR